MTWWQYLILANVYLILFYGFYALLLRRETFFQLNRFYLVSSAILSFLVPLIQADWARNLFITQRLKQTIYHLDPVIIYQLKPAQSQFTIGAGLAMIYIAGIVFLTFRFALQFYLLQRSLRNFETEEAYSFFKTIKLSDKAANHQVIMAHEEVHARQWHSADVLLIEAIMIINWFNPAVYFYRKSIKYIHEFIADRNAVKSGTSKQAYALLLLSETFKTPAHQLVNPFFNHSLLKQRIVMLQKNNSQRTQLLKYGLSAPLFALMLILSSATVRTNRVINIINNKAELIMSTPASAPAIEDAYSVVESPNADQHNTTVTVTPEVNDFEPSAKPPVDQHMADSTNNDQVFTVAETSPTFKGGMAAFGRYLGMNVKIPAGMMPTRVIVNFIVEKDGSVTHVKPLTETNTPAADEAVRVITASPKWNPGLQNGHKVRVAFTVPVIFSKANDRLTLFTTVPPDSSAKKQVTTLRLTSSANSNAPGSAIADTLKKANVILLKPTRVYLNNVTVRTVPMGNVAQGKAAGRAPADTSAKQVRISYMYKTGAPGAAPGPLYYLDDAEIDAAGVKEIHPDEISSINVVKGNSAVSIYGDRAINGVVLITTKKKAAKAPVKN